MRVLIATILRPTMKGIIYTPLALLYSFYSLMFSIIPGKFGDFLWYTCEDVLDVLTEETFKEIKNTRCLWDIEIFK